MRSPDAPLPVIVRFLPDSLSGQDPDDDGHARRSPGAAVPGRTGDGLDFEILTSISQVEDIAPEWRALHARAGHDPFSAYDMVHAWWRTTGVSDPRLRLHIVIARTGGRLMAVLPLVTVNMHGIRVLRGVGNNTERFTDIVCDDEAIVAETWRAARASRAYDFAICRGVFPGFPSKRALDAFARERDKIDDYYLVLSWPDANAWMASLSKNRKVEFTRNSRWLEKKAPVTFTACSDGPPPLDAIDTMLGIKRSWARNYSKGSWMFDASAEAYFHEIAKASADKGQLFLSWVACGDQKVAFMQGYLFRGVLYLELITYDPEWSKFSLGHIVLVNTIRWAFANGISKLVFGPGNNDVRAKGQNLFKVAYANQIVTGSEFTFSGTWRGRVVEAAFFCARKHWRSYQAKKLARNKKALSDTSSATAGGSGPSAPPTA